MNQFCFSFILLTILYSVHSSATACIAAGTVAPTSLPYAPHNCSFTCREQATAIASFRKGLSLIQRNLPSFPPVPSTCERFITISAHNIAEHPSINCKEGLQAVANSIGKMNAYLRLIQQSQIQSYSHEMQTLQDLLSGTVLDLYKVLSLTYCDCTEVMNPRNSFTIPHLNTSYFSDNCNLTEYISVTIRHELTRIVSLTKTWLDSQDVGTPSSITDSEWLSSHVTIRPPAK